MLGQKCSKIEQEISEIQIYTSITNKYISKIEAITMLVDFRTSYEIMNIRTNTGYSRSNSNSRYDLKEKFP